MQQLSGHKSSASKSRKSSSERPVFNQEVTISGKDEHYKSRDINYSKDIKLRPYLSYH